MAAKGGCSELELTLMTMIASGVTSGYAMKQKLNRMKSGRWSTQSGSIYRALSRLAESKLVEGVQSEGARRRLRTDYRLSPEGRRLAMNWLSQPMDASDWEGLVDPIRERAVYLYLLEPPDRVETTRKWLAQSRSWLRQASESVRDGPTCVSDVDGWSRYSLLLQAQARHYWLRRLYSTMRTPTQH
jgi:DNA-binding PadR family transcriptional regulator